jgi:aspartate aminotransferase
MVDELLGSLAPIVRFFDDSSWARRRGDPAMCDFVAGNPQDMPLPELVDTLRRRSVPRDKDWFAYTTNDPTARAAAAAALAAEQGIEVDPLDLTLTPGTFGALAIALRTVVDPGDEVVYISPPWFFYEAMIVAAAATPVRVTSEPDAFDLPLDAIEAAVTVRTRAVILNSPNNPSGRIAPAADLDRLAAILSAASVRSGRTVYLLSDESYRRILFDGASFVPPAAHYDATLVLYTYGKQLLAPGERLGYIATTTAMPDRERLRTGLTITQLVGGWQFPTTLMQHSLADLEPVTVDVAHMQERRDRMVGELRRHGYRVNRPQATFYLLVRSPIPDDVAFAERLAAHDVYVLPGTFFELPGYIRISLTASDDMIERSIPGFAAARAGLEA